MNKNVRNYGLYAMVGLLIVLMVMSFRGGVGTQRSYTTAQYEQALEKGEVDVEGKIDSLTYSDSVAKPTGTSILSRLFG